MSQNYTMLYNVTLKSIFEPNGTYHFVITASLVTASPSPASGNITVNGATVWVNITFTIEPYYLQKISITNTTILAGLNTADSNFLISTSSEVLLYTLITYTSPTELNISVRTPSGTTTLEIQEYEKFQSFITPAGYLQNVSTSFWTNITVPSTMPTFSFSKGTLWMANIVPQNISGMSGVNGEQGVYNNTWNTYSYPIAVAPNANYITVLYNSTWTFLNSETNPGTYIALTNSTYDFVTFYDVHGYSYITPTFIEQSTSYADFTINYYPTSAVMNEFGMALSYNAFLTYVNGNYSSSSLVPAQMGHTYNIKTYDIYGVLISDVNYTVDAPDSQVSIPINIYPVTVSNLNSTYAVGLIISARGTVPRPQNGSYLSPYDNIVYWLPVGKYYFNYTYVNYNTLAPAASVSRLINLTAPTLQVIDGVTLSQIQFSQQKNAQNLTNLVEAVNITFLNSNSNLLNETLIIESNILNTNTSIGKQVVSMNSTLNNVYSKIGVINNDIKVIQNNILSDVNSTSLNISTKIAVIKGFVAFMLQKQNSSMIDKISFSNPVLQGNGTYRFTVNILTPSGAPANLSSTQYVANNLNLRFVQGYAGSPLAYSISNIQPGSFTITIFGLNSTDVASLNSGAAVITASSNTSSIPSENNVALGLLGSFLANNLWQHSLLVLFEPVFWKLSVWDVFLVLITAYVFLVLNRYLRQSRTSKKKAWGNAKYHLFLWSIAFLVWYMMFAAYRGGLL